MEKIAVYSNDDELSQKLIDKFQKERMKVGHFEGMVYLIDKDEFVSHLALEMHHPEYKLIYGTEYLENNN